MSQDRLWSSEGTEDFELSAVRDWFMGQVSYRERLAVAVRRAFDDAINPFGTGRTSVEDLTKPEKTVVGMMVERTVREEFNLPRGKVLDFLVTNAEVDCKFSLKRGGWMIPPEAVGRLCLVVFANDSTSQLAVGLVRCSERVLSEGRNQDKKRHLSANGRDAIEWLVDGRVLPRNRLLEMGREEREAVLGRSDGERRARELFIRCEGIAFSPSAVGGSLAKAGYRLLSGDDPDDRLTAAALGGPVPRPGEWLCLRERDKY